jgi:hypothetical protein
MRRRTVSANATPQDPGDDDMVALLCLALDTAAADETRLRLLTTLALMRLDVDRDADLDRLRTAGPQRVTVL